MTQEQTKIQELAQQMTPLGVFEAICYGVESEEGRRFIELYGKLRELAGDTVTRNKDGTLDIEQSKQSKRKAA